jgi:hypothetical protein
MPADGRPFVLHLLFVVAVVGVLASTLWAWFWAGFYLDAGPLPRPLRVDEAVATGLGAGLLLAGGIPMRLLRVPRWIVVMVAGLVALLASACALEILAAMDAPLRHTGDDAWTVTVSQFCYAPTTWPMLLFVVVTPVVTARSRRARR